MAVGKASQLRKTFEKLFPERQIYHRSGGSVRYVSISPWRQAAMAGGATLLVGWCLFATVSVLLRSTGSDLASTAAERRINTLERQLQQAEAQSAFALSLLEERSSGFTKEIEEIQKRQDTLKVLLAKAMGQETGDAVALKGDGGAILVDSSIEEADARQSRQANNPGPQVEVAGYRAQLEKLRNEQAIQLDQAEDQAVLRAERARGILGQTGVSISRVMEQSNVGGPLMDIQDLDPAATTLDGKVDPFRQRAMEVYARLQEQKLLESLIHTVPLGAPVAVPYRETSGYGERPDPFTRSSAWHDGLDLATGARSPIIATAPGRVSFAGVKSGYGNVVIVDHGLGFETRYGHLSSIAVKVGMEVALGQKLGIMGNTGRSTGTHLHYEVKFRNRTFDPIRFLKAGKHVYKG